jgi:hypothetical protein
MSVPSCAAIASILEQHDALSIRRLVQYLRHGLQASHPDNGFALTARALNLPSEGDDVFQQQPIDDVGGLDRGADAPQKLLIELGIFAFDQPARAQERAHALGNGVGGVCDGLNCDLRLCIGRGS